VGDSSFYDCYDPFEYMSRQAESRGDDEDDDENEENQDAIIRDDKEHEKVVTPSTPSGQHVKKVMVFISTRGRRIVVFLA